MSSPAFQIYIIDDESSVSEAYARLVRSAKMLPRTFPSVDEFMRAEVTDADACVISDVRMPGTSGLELPSLLARAGRTLPVILVTAHDTQETRDNARRVGAAAYFRKPVDDQALLDAIAWAVGATAKVG
jgi:FixJ family two-component response regulator